MTICDSIIINGVEHDQIDGYCTCVASWPRIMQFIGEHTSRPNIGEELVIHQMPFDIEVTAKEIPT